MPGFQHCESMALRRYEPRTKGLAAYFVRGSFDLALHSGDAAFIIRNACTLAWTRVRSLYSFSLLKILNQKRIRVRQLGIGLIDPHHHVIYAHLFQFFGEQEPQHG